MHRGCSAAGHTCHCHILPEGQTRFLLASDPFYFLSVTDMKDSERSKRHAYSDVIMKSGMWLLHLSSWPALMIAAYWACSKIENERFKSPFLTSDILIFCRQIMTCLNCSQSLGWISISCWLTPYVPHVIFTGPGSTGRMWASMVWAPKLAEDRQRWLLLVSMVVTGYYRVVQLSNNWEMMVLICDLHKDLDCLVMLDVFFVSMNWPIMSTSTTQYQGRLCSFWTLLSTKSLKIFHWTEN